MNTLVGELGGHGRTLEELLDGMEVRRLNPTEFLDRFLDPEVHFGFQGSKTPAQQAFCRVTLR